MRRINFNCLIIVYDLLNIAHQAALQPQQHIQTQVNVSNQQSNVATSAAPSHVNISNSFHIVHLKSIIVQHKSIIMIRLISISGKFT